MKICIDARKYFDFGIGTYLGNILKQFAKIENPHQFYLLVAPDDLPRLKNLPGQFILIREASAKYSVREHFSIPLLLKKLNVDLYHSPHYVIPLIKTKPTLTIIHDIIHLRFSEQLKTPGAYFYAKFMIKHAIKNSDKLVTISEWSKRDIIQFFHLSDPSIDVIYAAVDANFRKIYDNSIVNNVLKKLNIHSPYLLYTGAFKPHKNIHGLIRAFAQLDRRECPKLVLAGDRLEKYVELQALIQQLNLQKHIINPGWLELEEFLALYSGATAFVFPSLYEGFGLPPLEAMQCEVPVASSNASCMPEILGDAAHYFDPRSVDDMAAKISDVLNDDLLRRDLIIKGKQQIRKYSWEKSARQFLELYKKIHFSEAR